MTNTPASTPHINTGTESQPSDIGSELKAKGQQLKDSARDMASKVADKAEDATTSVGSGMRSMAEGLRERAPQGGMIGRASEAVADTLESAGRHLEEGGLSGLGNDMTNLVRRYPLPSLLVGIGLGFLLARATTRR
jgi:hypothetical protein